MINSISKKIKRAKIRLKFQSLPSLLMVMLYGLILRFFERNAKSQIGFDKLIQYLRHKKIAIRQTSKNEISFSHDLFGKPFSFTIAKNTSDALVFDQIILENEYAPIIAILDLLSIHPKIIIDAGSNVGFTTFYFNSKYPDATIYALEPNPGTFKRLCNNIKENKLSSIFTINKGLWNRKIILLPNLEFGDQLDWAFSLQESKGKGDKGLEAIGVLDILEIYQLEIIDFLKIDIEGGEKNVFDQAHDLTWLYRVRIISIEIHFLGEEKTKILDVLEKHGFDHFDSVQTTVGINRQL